MRLGGFRSGGSGFSSGSVGGVATATGGRTFKSGGYYPPMLFGLDTAVAPVQSTEYAVRFEVGVSTTFETIGLEITTFVAATVVRLGIRADTGQTYPGTLILDAGTIDSSASIGFKEITINQVLAPGRYWLTSTLQGGTGVAIRSRAGDPFIAHTSGVTTNASAYLQTGVTGALPGAFSTTTSTNASSVPKILLKAA